MSIVKEFNFENLNVAVVKEGGDIWFKGRDVALALGYKKPENAIRDHVRKNEKRKVQQTCGVVKTRVNFINEPGLYRLIFSSKLESAEKFKTWVFSEVLPSIRKTGQYQAPMVVGNQLVLMNENDLHYQVVKYIREYHPSAIIVPGLGEFQDTSPKRINGYKKGYKGGQPDILLLNRTSQYSGLAIELKTPKRTGRLSNKQADYLENLKEQGYMTMVSDNYDEIHRAIDEYFRNVRIKCPHCCKKFRSRETLGGHLKWFHRI